MRPANITPKLFYGMLLLAWVLFFAAILLPKTESVSTASQEYSKPQPLASAGAAESGGLGSISIQFDYSKNRAAILRYMLQHGVVMVKHIDTGEFYRVKAGLKLEKATNIDVNLFAPTLIDNIGLEDTKLSGYSHLSLWWPLSLWKTLEFNVKQLNANGAVFSVKVENGVPTFALKSLQHFGKPLTFSSVDISAAEHFAAAN